MDVRTVVEATSWCGTVLSRTLAGSHGHPRFSFSMSFGCSVFAAAASVTACYCTSNRDSAALADAAVTVAGSATLATFAAVPVDAAATHAAAAAVAVAAAVVACC